MATSYPNGNEGVLHSVTHIGLSSTVTVSKEGVKPELVFNSNLVNCESVDVRVKEQPFLTCSSLLQRLWTDHRSACSSAQPLLLSAELVVRKRPR